MHLDSMNNCVTSINNQNHVSKTKTSETIPILSLIRHLLGYTARTGEIFGWNLNQHCKQICQCQSLY